MSLSARLANLSPEKRQLLMQRLQSDKSSEAVQQRQIQPQRPLPEFVPLSFNQQRLWFLDKLQPDSASYNTPIAIEIVGNLNMAALQQTVREIVCRHEVLRTYFVETADGRPAQAITPDPVLPFVNIDLVDLSKQLQDKAIARLTAEFTQRPFQLDRTPPVRTALIWLGSQRYILLATVHHILADGWSVGIITREFHVLYTAFSRGLDSPLPDLSVQYADYAIWQRQWLQGERFARQLDFWKQQMAGERPVLQLPTDRPRPAVQSFAGAKYKLALPDELYRNLKALSKAENCTLFVTLLTAFKTLLYRYTGQEDITLGTAMVNRDRPQLKSAIGFFANTVLLRSTLGGNPAFTKLLQQVSQTTVSALSHQELPFDVLVKTLQPDRDLSRNPLFQVWFALHQTPMQKSLDLAGLKWYPIPVSHSTSRVDLSLDMAEIDKQLFCIFEYSTDLFDNATIAAMGLHFQTMLTDIVAHPSRRLSELALLSEADIDTILQTSRAPALPVNPDVCLHHLFEQQVRRTPDAISVSDADRSLTYRGLNERAERLAGHLRSLGVGSDRLVALCSDRSVDLPIGMLGILKAGAAYVPIDPAYPEQRIAMMLKDSGAEVVVTHSHLKAELPVCDAKVVLLDGDAEALTAAATIDDKILPGVHPQQLAYQIYTSGSTGKPKGVQISHAAVANFLAAMRQAPGIASDDVLLSVTTLSFDIAVLEIFLPLTTGARVAFASRDVAADAMQLAELVETSGATVMQATPVTWQMLLDSGWTGKADLKVLCGGEALSLPLAQALSRSSGELWNLYGPTEATVWTAARRISPTDTSVSLGQAIANTQLYVLDRQTQLVPTNVPGELHVGGVGLARGYFKRSALTAERFCPDPLSQESGARLYKTGDLVRYRRDGSLEFLGRIDNQIKLRGFRIELGEIESCLLSAPDVNAAVVVVREDSAGQKRLVAYAIPGDTASKPASSVNNSDLNNSALNSKTKLWRQHLQAKLPAYMVPHAFVVLETFPLTPNGKVDRNALPAPDSGSDLAITYEPPQTSTQQFLCDIWSEVLNQDRIGIHDNFFELGGDSIVAMQAVAKAKQSGMHVTPKQLFQNQTIEELAAVVTLTSKSPAQQEPISGEVLLTPFQHRFLSHNRLGTEEQLGTEKIPGAQQYVRSATIELPAGCQLILLQSALEHLHAHHDGLRLQFSSTETGWEAEISPPQSLPLLSTVALSLVDSSERETLRHQGMSQAIYRLNLEQGSLMQAVLFDQNPDGLQLFICGHSLAIDERSWDILLTDLATIYHQLDRGQDIDLPAKTTSVKTWNNLLAEAAHSPHLRSELSDYWSAIGSAEIAKLPTDLSDFTPETIAKPETITKTERVSIRLDTETTRILLNDLPSLYNADICDGILTALVETVGQTGTAVLIQVGGNSREAFSPHVDVSRTVGNFTSSFPLLFDGSHRKSPKEALKAIKETVRAVPRSGVGFGILHYLSGDRDVQSLLQSFPQADLSLTYLQPLDAKQLGGTDWQLLPNSISDFCNTVDLEASHNSPEKLAIVAQLQDNYLCFDWHYNPQLHQEDTVNQLAQQLVQSLQNLATHCQSSHAGGYTPSDFPLANVEAAELTKLFGHSREIADLYPLSPVQEGMLFHTLYSPEAGLYFDQTSCKLTGTLNIDGFKLAWAQVIQQYDVLRTAFLWQELDRPLQAVHHVVPLPWKELDWQQFDAPEQRTRLNEFLRAERERGFDLAQPPLMRLTLIHLGSDIHYFVWSRHHLLLDGWSLPLVMQAVLFAYDALCKDKAPNSQELTIPVAPPYRDYIAWLQRQSLDEAKSFWREYLLGWKRPLAIASLGQQPLDVATKPSSGSNYAECTVSITADRSRQLETCVRQQRLTLNTLIQGLWSIALAHYSGQQDLVFGATIAGRPTDLPDVEAMVGLFINTLPVRVQVDADANLLSWLQQLQAAQLELNRYAYSPLADIQMWGDIRGERLFDTIVVFENYPVDAALERQVANLSLQGLGNEIDNGYPLTLRAVPKQKLALQLIYDSHRLAPATVQQLANHLKVLLDRVLESTGPDGAGPNITELVVGDLNQLLQVSSQQRFKQASRQKLGQVRRKAIRRSISAPLGGQDS